MKIITLETKGRYVTVHPPPPPLRCDWSCGVGRGHPSRAQSRGGLPWRAAPVTTRCGDTTLCTREHRPSAEG